MKSKTIYMDLENDIFILAISYRDKMYHLAWELNRVLECEMALIPEFEFAEVSHEDGFIFYGWEDPSEHYMFGLINSRGPKGSLLKGYENTDYFFVITGFFEELDTKAIIRKIRDIPNVLAVFPVDTTKLQH